MASPNSSSDHAHKAHHSTGSKKSGVFKKTLVLLLLAAALVVALYPNAPAARRTDRVKEAPNRDVNESVAPSAQEPQEAQEAPHWAEPPRPEAKPLLSPLDPSVPAPNEQVRITGTVTNGFVHPGIGLTAELLNRARTNVIARKEPWYSEYRKLASDPYSGKGVKARNESRSHPGLPDSDAFDSQGMEARMNQDSAKAQRQALMYFFTGDETYRANALAIIRVWSKMAPSKYKPYPDCQIHSGYPLRAMLTAAEILRYTTCNNASLDWTREDTEHLTKNLITPMISTFMNQNGWFMNQNNFALIGAMSGFIFTNNREGYHQRVEWFTVNRSGPNQGHSGAIKQLARRVDTNAQTGEKLATPVVQLVEMGRDQAHGAEDINLFVNISNMMIAQGTKVDPVQGTVSTRSDAVGPYEFLNDRILATADYFCRYMLGYDTPWIPVAHDIAPGGEIRNIYPRLSDQYRGRMTTFGFWHLYFYYTYVRKVNVAQVAPYFYEAFQKRITSLDWLYLPAAAEREGGALVLEDSEPNVVNIDRRTTVLSAKPAAADDQGKPYIRVTPGRDGAKFAILSAATPNQTIGLRVRTTGAARLEMSGFKQPWILPDTGGQWRYVTYTMGEYEKLDNLVYFRVTAEVDQTVDFDQLLLKPAPGQIAPEFKQGGSFQNLVCYVGVPLAFDFSAATAGVTYVGEHLPEGAQIQSNSGAFSWKPATPGNYSFIVEARAGETIATKLVNIAVASDRNAALLRVAASYDSRTEYVRSTLDAYLNAYRQTQSLLPMASNELFYAQLQRLQEAAGALQLLTPKLPDGSLDYTRCAVSPELGVAIAKLADQNNDTFPEYRMAVNRGYTFDFGSGFKFSVDAFAMQGRLNFEERMADTAFFGSDDAKNWTRLSPETTVYSKEFSWVKVSPGLRKSAYRYLRVEKQRGERLFEPSELRIYGRRIEADAK